MTPVLVIHDLGAVDAGAPWRHAFRGWNGPVDAPDLPGHGSAPPVVGGHHEPGDAVFALADRLPSPDDEALILGVGANGMVARTLALAGRAAGVVLVDGLGGPWLDVDRRNAARVAARRAILSTPAAVGPPPADGIDPRARMMVDPGDRDFVIRVLQALTVPLLVVESSASKTSDAEELVALASQGVLVRVADAEPSKVVGVVEDWWTEAALSSSD